MKVVTDSRRVCCAEYGWVIFCVCVCVRCCSLASQGMHTIIVGTCKVTNCKFLLIVFVNTSPSAVYTNYYSSDWIFIKLFPRNNIV
jgi:hypothetical protein